jgi:hypothetical protein
VAAAETVMEADKFCDPGPEIDKLVDAAGWSAMAHEDVPDFVEFR